MVSIRMNIQFLSGTASSINRSKVYTGLKNLRIASSPVSQIKVTWEDLSGVEHSQTIMVKLSDAFTVGLSVPGQR